MSFILNPYRYVSAGGGSNISFLGSLPVVSSTNGGAITLTFSNFVDSAGSSITLLQDDVVVIGVGAATAFDATMATSSSGWTKVGETYANGSNSDANGAIFYKRMGASPDTSFVFSAVGGSTSSVAATAIVFRGVNTSTIEDVTATTATGTGTGVPDPPSITPATAGSWPVVFAMGATGVAPTNITNPGDLSSTTNHFRNGTSTDTFSPQIALGFKDNWTSGAFDCAVFGGGTALAGDSWASTVIALRSS